MRSQPRTESTPAMSLRFGKSIGVALLVAAGLFALVLALNSPSTSGVAAHECTTEEDMHVDFQRTGAGCGEDTHQGIHEHSIEVDGGRHRDLIFKVYVPEIFRDDGDKIEIEFEQSFDLPEVGTVLSDGKITIGKAESTTPTPAPIVGTVMLGNKVFLAITTDHSGILNGDDDDYTTITMKAETGIETPETPWGPDTPRGFVSDHDPKGDKGYEIELTFVDTGGDRMPAEDKNYVVVINPISSTVPGATVQLELATDTRELIRSSDEIVVDFSGPSADSGFSVPSSMTTSRIQVDYDYVDGEYKKRFNPSDVQVLGERVIFSVPRDKDDNTIAFNEDYLITFKSLARIKNPFSAGIKTIKVSSFVSDEVDTIEAVVRRTTTVNPQEGPRGSEFTLEGKGYAAGTVTVYRDADTNKQIDPGETLASVKTVRGAFKTKLIAGGNPGEAEYEIRARDSEGDDISVKFDIRSSLSFEPQVVAPGSQLTIIIADWEAVRGNVVAVQIGGEPVQLTGRDVQSLRDRRFLSNANYLSNCIHHPDAPRALQGRINLTVDVPLGIPLGEQTVAVFDHFQLDYEAENINLDEDEEKEACTDLGEEEQSIRSGQELTQKFRNDDPVAITKGTVEIVAKQLEFSRSSAARGQRITVSGSDFSRGTSGDNGIQSVLINGIPVAEDPAQFEVTTSGNFALTVTVPMGAVDGDNEVRVEGTESSLALGMLTVPAAAIELSPPESRRGERVRVTGSNFIANRSVRLYYGDGGTDLGAGDTSIGSAFADSTGVFTFTFNVPITAEIGETHKVTAVAEAEDEGGNDVTVRAEADHGPPGAEVTTEPESVSPGDMLTVKGRNMPPFAQVRPIRINGIDVTPGPNPGTDRNGAFEAKVVVPQLELGDQLLRVEVSGVVVTRVISLVHSSIGRPPTEVFGTLIDAESLGRVWLYDNSDQSWSLFDPDPVFDEFNTLEKLDAGQIVWMSLTKDATFQGQDLRVGWSLVKLR